MSAAAEMRTHPPPTALERVPTYTREHLRRKAAHEPSLDGTQLIRDRSAYIKYLEGELERVADMAVRMEELGAGMQATEEKVLGIEEQYKGFVRLVKCTQQFVEEQETGYRRDMRILHSKVEAAEQHLKIKPILTATSENEKGGTFDLRVLDAKLRLWIAKHEQETKARLDGIEQTILHKLDSVVEEVRVSMRQLENQNMRLGKVVADVADNAASKEEVKKSVECIQLLETMQENLKKELLNGLDEARQLASHEAAVARQQFESSLMEEGGISAEEEATGSGIDVGMDTAVELAEEGLSRGRGASYRMLEDVEKKLNQSLSKGARSIRRVEEHMSAMASDVRKSSSKATFVANAVDMGLQREKEQVEEELKALTSSIEEVKATIAVNAATKLEREAEEAQLRQKEEAEQERMDRLKSSLLTEMSETIREAIQEHNDTQETTLQARFDKYQDVMERKESALSASMQDFRNDIASELQTTVQQVSKEISTAKKEDEITRERVNDSLQACQILAGSFEEIRGDIVDSRQYTNDLYAAVKRLAKSKGGGASKKAPNSSSTASRLLPKSRSAVSLSSSPSRLTQPKHVVASDWAGTLRKSQGNLPTSMSGESPFRRTAEVYVPRPSSRGIGVLRSGGKFNEEGDGRERKLRELYRELERLNDG